MRHKIQLVQQDDICELNLVHQQLCYIALILVICCCISFLQIDKSCLASSASGEAPVADAQQWQDRVPASGQLGGVSSGVLAWRDLMLLRLVKTSAASSTVTQLSRKALPFNDSESSSPLSMSNVSATCIAAAQHQFQPCFHNRKGAFQQQCRLR